VSVGRAGRELATVAVATDPLTTEIRSVPIPAVDPDGARLAVEGCGVCGTDWDLYRRVRGADLGPLILGHEVIGRLEALGERAATTWQAFGGGPLRVGDRVAVEEFLPCGRCRACRAGQHALCPDTDSRGAGPFLRYGTTSLERFPQLWGGFATHMALHPRSILHRVPKAIPIDQATLVVPIANGLSWIRDAARLEPGGAIVIVGTGQHALGCLIGAREAQAGVIVLAGRSRSAARLRIARELGATRTVAYDQEDLEAAVLDATGGELADVVVDVTAGDTAVPALAPRLARPLGTVVLAGGKQGRAIDGLDHDLVVRRALTIMGVRGHGSRGYEDAIGVISSGRHRLELVATHRFPLAATDEALRMVGERTDPAALHVTVVVDGT
jgi:threonine dehydrogenase-like Zn-dependent dehydrogenase